MGDNVRTPGLPRVWPGDELYDGPVSVGLDGTSLVERRVA